LEISQVRKRVQSAIASGRDRAQQRRQRSDDAEREFALFLQTIATPLAQQAATALKAEGLPFTVFTPGDGVRLVYDRGRDNFVEFALDTSGDRPQVIGRISQTRGSRGFEEERPLRLNAAPSELTEDEVLEFLMQAVESWLAR
jgi:hypothetical protein